MSTDHSLVAELVQSGVLTPEMAEKYPYRNVITRAVGTDKNIKVDVANFDKDDNDLWLLCSDGLTEYVKPKELLETLLKYPSDEAADRLIKLALDRGGRDNITLLILGAAL